MFEKYDEEMKSTLSIAAVAMLSFTIAVFAASIAVGFLYGAGCGFGLFAAIALVMALYFYIAASVKAYKNKKSKQRYRELLANLAPTTLDPSSDSSPIRVVKGTPKPDFTIVGDENE